MTRREMSSRLPFVLPAVVARRCDWTGSAEGAPHEAAGLMSPAVMAPGTANRRDGSERALVRAGAARRRRPWALEGRMTMLNVARKYSEIDSEGESAACLTLSLVRTGSTEEPPAEESFYDVMLNMWIVTFVASHV